jgi:hypothetical protein
MVCSSHRTVILWSSPATAGPPDEVGRWSDLDDFFTIFEQGWKAGIACDGGFGAIGMPGGDDVKAERRP